MSGLILQRVVQDRAQRRRVADRRAVEKALVAVMQGRAEAAFALRPFRRRARLMSETLLDFMSVVRGHDREVVVAALETVGVQQGLRARLRRGSMPGRLAAIEALAAFPGSETEKALRDVARESPQLRLTALEALSRAGYDVPVRDLLDAAAQGDLRASGRFAEFLRERVVEHPQAGVGELARTDLSPELRVLLLEALGASGDYSVITALAANASHVDAAVRAAAVRALGRLQHPAGQAAVAAALDDPDPEVRAAGAGAAGEARLGRLADTLYARLSDDAWRVRFQAAAALGKLGPAGLERLRQAAALPDPAAQRAASLTLAELGA
ncbi:HEAT repeat domain-containing protein [Phenylobacterium sp.]|uniref:HEAT repeat domain-containing protein n=1 Tax=Phenylobacterium sp. TaxID=1871053 RepID=UPI00281179F0|nr:HEAT repeat domain-containing protein [Phenylobacterium sp.]